MKEDLLSQIGASEQLVIQPDMAAVAPVPADEMPFVRRLFAKVFRPSFRQATVVLFDQGFCSIANFLTGVFVARACGEEIYGLYVLAIALIMTSVGIQSSLISIPFTVYSPHLKGDSRGSYYGSSLLFHVVFSAFWAGSIAVAGILLSLNGKYNLFANMLFAASIASTGVLLRDFVRCALLAELRVWTSLIMSLAANSFLVCFLLCGYRIQFLTLSVVCFALAVSSGIAAATVLILSRHQICIRRGEIISDLKINWKFGRWTLAKSVAYIPTTRVYPWALTVVVGITATSIYGACMSVVSMVNPFFMGLSSYLGPKTAHLARNGTNAVKHVVYHAVAFLMVPLGLLLFVCLLWGGQIVTLLYGFQYEGLNAIVAVCSLSVVVSAATTPIIMGIYALEKPSIAFKAEVIAGVVSTIIGLPLIYLSGPLGAAQGILLARIASGLYCHISFLRIVRPR